MPDKLLDSQDGFDLGLWDHKLRDSLPGNRGGPGLLAQNPVACLRPVGLGVAIRTCRRPSNATGVAAASHEVGWPVADLAAAN